VTQRPNILLVVLDTARADGFTPYSSARSTPAIAQLASRGTAYPNAIAPSCWTMPSHASFFLGAPPRSLGLSRIPNGEGTLCKPVIEAQRDRYLPEVLRRSGYSTAAVSANLWVSERIGFSLGFESFAAITGHRVAAMSQKGWRARASWYRAALRSRVDDGARIVEETLRTWIANRPRAPFFWFVNLLECHSPYLPPRPYNDLGPLGRLAAAEDARKYQNLTGVLRTVATESGVPRRSARRMRHLYDRSILQMDDWLARILEALDGVGVLDSTTVIVTSDHGENFGEAGLLGHAGSLDDRLLRVPLVMAGPGVSAADDRVVSLVDLPRIIARIAGLDDHPWGPEAHPGIAVAQYDGPMPPEHPNAHVLDEWGPTVAGRRRLTRRFTAATDGSLKIVRSEEGDILYDIAADPLERVERDVGAYASDRVAPLVRALDRATEEAWDPAPTQAPAEDPAAVAEIEERMRLLGYL
jgi:arylsulfatase A-like enzyme